ncbi:MAG: lysophospholipid acyltransferase family protein [Desulfarculaceae bacterium]
MSLAYHILRGGLLLTSLQPMALARALGRGLGKLGFSLDQRHRLIVQNNLQAAYPNCNKAWLETTAKLCFAHLGQVAMEIPHIVRLSPEQIAARTRYHGLENWEAANARNKGVMFLTGHIGNWEWTSLAVGYKVGELCVVARPLDWPPADQMVNHWRTKTGHQIVPKANSARKLLRTLQNKGQAAVLLDQNVDWYDGVWVDFFGRPACTNKGLALLALHTGAPVVPGYALRADDGFFDVFIEPEIPLVKTGDKTKDVWQNTQNYTSALERIIRQKPEQWFWMHQRWKTKPYHLWPRERN